MKLLLCVLLVLSVSVAQAANWELILDEKKIQVFTDKKKDGIMPFMAKSKISSNYQDLADILMNYERKHEWAPKLGWVGMCYSQTDLDTRFDYVTAEEARKWNLPHATTAGPENLDKYASYIEAALPQEFREAGLDTTGALEDGKDWVTENVRTNSAKSNAMFSSKMHTSCARCISWILPNGFNFENTGLYLGRCPECRLVQLWGTTDTENFNFASLQADVNDN